MMRWQYVEKVYTSNKRVMIHLSHESTVTNPINTKRAYHKQIVVDKWIPRGAKFTMT